MLLMMMMMVIGPLAWKCYFSATRIETHTASVRVACPFVVRWVREITDVRAYSSPHHGELTDAVERAAGAS